MTSPPTTPRSPRSQHRSKSSSAFTLSTGDTSRSPSTTDMYHESPRLRRRSSRTSQISTPPQSPILPRRLSFKSSKPSSWHVRRASGASIASTISSRDGDAGGGFGNLADELEHILDDEDGQGDSFLEGLREGNFDSPVTESAGTPNPFYGSDMHDMGYGIPVETTLAADPASPTTTSATLSPQKQSSRQRSSWLSHQRHEPVYDGFDHGPESDPDEMPHSLSPLLRKRIHDVENVTRLSVNTEDAVSERGGVIRRTVHALKDLSPQNNIEFGVARLVTAYTSMALHRTHKTREIFTQSHSLMYAGILDLPEEVVDLLLDEVNSLIFTVPFMLQENPLLSLQMLAAQTMDLTQTLRSVTDLLQESKIATTVAARQLKNVKEMVDDLLLEEDLFDHSIMLIQAGDWDRRCRERHAAKACREVVDGFADLWGVDVESLETTSIPREVSVTS